MAGQTCLSRAILLAEEATFENAERLNPFRAGKEWNNKSEKKQLTNG